MVDLLLAPGFEEVEALTPADYLRRAGQEVRLVGVGSQVVTGSHGITVHCDCIIEEAQGLPRYACPAGRNAGHTESGEKHMLQKDRGRCWGGKYVAAICAAPSILGHMGLLEGKRATCFPGFEEALQGAEYENASVVCDGNIITAKGAGAANQFAFALVEALCGKEQADGLKAAVQWE